MTHTRGVTSMGVSRRRGLPWRAAVVVLTLLAAVGLAAPVGSPPAATAVDDCAAPASTIAPIQRASGFDRFATAACVSSFAYPDGADHVLLARGDAAGGLADALAGAVLAHAVAGPILLTEPDRLPATTYAELVRLEPATVTLLGGAAAISPRVAAAVADLDADVERLEGPDRFATAAAISAAAEAAGTAFIVNGFRPADSLAAAGPAARSGAALLLTAPDRLPGVTRQAVAGFSEVVIVGGHGVVPDAVEEELRRLVGPDRIRRVSGGTRAETAASLARAFPAGSRRFVVSQLDAHLVDAATAGWAAALADGGPVLYAERDRPAPGTDRFLRLGGLRPVAGFVPDTFLVGGAGVLAPALVTVLERRYDEAAHGGPPPQLRGIWVHLFDDALKSRRGIATVLNAASRANLNTVIVQVTRRQDAYYRSDVLPRTVDPALPADLDILAELAYAARDRGLALHAWVSALPAYHSVYDGLPLDPNHIWVRHGAASADPWTTRSNTGDQSVFLDPGVAGVQDHVAAVARELAERYDIDAVHMDYLRYEGAAWGYHPVSLARYHTQTGATGTPAPSDPAWQQWRRAQTQDLARRILIDVADADPDVAVSLAASTMGAGPTSAGGFTATRTYADVFQNWPAWLEHGLIDAAFPMNYFREHDTRQRAWFDDWVAFEAGLPRGARTLAVGQAAYLNTVEGSIAQIRRAAPVTDGVVLYSYQQNAASGHPHSLLSVLPTTVFPDPAPAPAVMRRDPGRGHATVRAADGVVVQAEPVAGGEGRSVRADATGRAGFPHLPAGSWRLSAAGYRPITVTVEPGAVTTAVLTH
jgi:uncharacterized lipoprotein YddW (UPF0748 family)/putative cell wall-binding protein